MPEHPSILSERGFDTWLARILHERQRVELPVLQRLLADARGGGATLADSLCGSGHLERAELEGYLNELLGSGEREPGAGRWRTGSSIDGYTLEEELGAGGMGIVYRARHEATGATYALKTVLAGADAELRLRFQREGEAQARVDAHPNVVRVHALGRARGRLYLVMDLAEGGDLEARLARGPLPVDDAARLVCDLARGLAWVHQGGVLHRDLKPQNILFGDRGVPKLVDFGLARLAESTQLTQTGAIMGSPPYMPPEQAEGRRDAVDERSDVYGLGAVLYHCLTGGPPFEGESAMSVLVAVIQDAPRRPSALRSDLPPALEAICLRCLEKKPADRYQSAQALADALDGFLAGDAGEVPPPRWRTPALIGVAVVTLVGAVAWALGGASPPIPADVTSSEPPETGTSEPAPREPVQERAGPDGVSTFKRATKFFEAGELAKAEPLANSVVLDPGGVAALQVVWLRARIRAGLANHKGALEDADLAEALGTPMSRPWLSEIRLLRGELHLSLGYGRAALEDFERVLRQEPGSVEALQGQFEALRRLGQAQAAVQVLKTLRERAPGRQVELTVALERARDDERLQLRTRQQVSELKRRFRRGRAGGDEVAQALKGVERFLDYDGWLLLGEALAREGRNSKAERALSRALELKDGAMAYRARAAVRSALSKREGDLSYARGELDQVAAEQIGEITRAMRDKVASLSKSFSPRTRELLVGLDASARCRSRRLLLLDLLNNAIRRRPLGENQALRFARARVRAALGHLPQAHEDCLAVARKGGLGSAVPLAAALIQLRLGRYQAVREALAGVDLAGVPLRVRELAALLASEARRMGPEREKAHEALEGIMIAAQGARLFREGGLERLDEQSLEIGRQLLGRLQEIVLRVDGRNSRGYSFQGQLQVALGRVDVAEHSFNHALFLDPGSPHALFERAHLHFKKRRPKLALRDLEAAKSSLRVWKGSDAERARLRSSINLLQGAIGPLGED